MNDYARSCYVEWFAVRPFFSDYVGARVRSHGFRNLFSHCAVCAKTNSVPVLASALKAKPKTCPPSSRFRELVINGLCLLIALYCLTRPTKNPAMRMKSSIAGQVIFDGYVNRDTQVIVPVWVGEWPNQTQTVAYTQFKDLWKYEQKSKDSLGWVW